MESNPNIHDNKGSPYRDKASRNAFSKGMDGLNRAGGGGGGCKDKVHNKFVSTQALLVSSEPLSTHGLERWRGMSTDSPTELSHNTSV